MKIQLQRLSFSILALSVFVLFESSVPAQCVQCKPTGGTFVCTGSPKGGCSCITIGGGSACALDGACGTGQKCEEASHTKSGVKFEEATILEIAQVHPRFAAALASLNRTGGLKTWAQVFMIPARLEAYEALNFLKSTPETEYFFRKYRSRQMAGASNIVIEFTLTKVDATHSVVRGNITSSFSEDPSATQLEIELTGDRVVSWRAY